MNSKLNELLSLVKKQVGVTEYPPSSNCVKYNTWFYGKKVQGASYPWCMAFVQWCFDQIGMPLPHKTASCNDLLSWYKRYAPECIVSRPKAGDIVIYTFGHTGIVVDGSNYPVIHVVEGNTSPGESGSQDNGGGVFLRKRGSSLVKAYIRPYQFEEDIMTGEEIYKALDSYMKAQKVPAWAKEELEQAVKMGITDGKDPTALIPRYQAAIMTKRALEKAK